jgi:hypothetical protein
VTLASAASYEAGRRDGNPLRPTKFAVFGAGGQLAALAVAAASLIVLVVDRDRYAARL